MNQSLDQPAAGLSGPDLVSASSWPRTISVVIPTLDEAETLPETLRRVRAVPEVLEVIVVDGGSRDATAAVASAHGARVLQSRPGRGTQMRLGAQHARGDVVLLLHADTWVPPEAGAALLRCLRNPRVVGGGFWKRFDRRHPLLLGSRLKCALRIALAQHVFGDQGFFVRRAALEAVGGVPDVPLMEDFELARALRPLGRLVLADATVVTSARRFLERGVLRTKWRMFYVWLRYRLGTPPDRLARLYHASKPPA